MYITCGTCGALHYWWGGGGKISHTSGAGRVPNSLKLFRAKGIDSFGSQSLSIKGLKRTLTIPCVHLSKLEYRSQVLWLPLSVQNQLQMAVHYSLKRSRSWSITKSDARASGLAQSVDQLTLVWWKRRDAKLLRRSCEKVSRPIISKGPAISQSTYKAQGLLLVVDVG